MIEVATCCDAAAMSCAVAATAWIDADVSCIAAALVAAESARLAMLTVTCSMDADISVIEFTSCSADVATDPLCVAVSFSEAPISLTPLSASSRLRVCSSAPSLTSCASRPALPTRWT